MKRLMIVLALMNALLACSTSPKNEGEESYDATAPTDSAAWGGDGELTKASPSSSSSSKNSSVERPRSSGGDPYRELTEASKTQNDERIRAAAHEILRHVKDDERALNALAMSAYRSGKYDLASYFLNKAVQKNPNRGELQSNLGLVELGRGEKGNALKAFRRALELKSDDGVAAANAGALYVEAKDYQKAATALEIAYRSGARDPKTLNNYGIALAATGQYEKALSVYNTALKEAGSSRELMFNKAVLLIDNMGQMKEGLDLVNRVKFMGPPAESREKLSALENTAKAGLNK